jgi:hypothetical protein
MILPVNLGEEDTLSPKMGGLNFDTDIIQEAGNETQKHDLVAFTAWHLPGFSRQPG